MPRKTPQERAEALLKIHAGRCFIPKESDLLTPFRTMEAAGAVTISSVSIYGFGSIMDGYNITSKDYHPERAKSEELETPAH